MAVKHVAASLAINVSGAFCPYKGCFNMLLEGLKVPFGALVDARPPKILLDKLLKFGPRTIPSVFLGCHFGRGGDGAVSTW